MEILFYSNEKNEPIHIHCEKAESECKFWIDQSDYDIRLAYEYNLSQADKNF